MSLTAKQEAFAVSVAKGATGADAYRAAYDAKGMKPETLHKRVGDLLKHGGIAGRIEALRAPALRKAELSVERTLLEVGRVSGSDLRRLMHPDGRPKQPHEWDDDIAAAVSSVEYDKDTGQISKLKLWDKNAGLEKAMKHLGLFERDNTQQREHLVLKIETAAPVVRR